MGFFPGPETSTVITPGPWYDGKMVVHGNIMDLYDDGAFEKTVTDIQYTNPGEIALQNHYGSYTNFDDVRVRKYAATEPTTSIGSEIASKPRGSSGGAD